MKLYSSDNADLMEVNALKTQGNALVVSGTIMGAMPIEARLPPSELRRALKLLNVRLVVFMIGMLFRK